MKKYIALLFSLLAGTGIFLYFLPEEDLSDGEDISFVRVYETEADSKEDCASFEEYDSRDMVCRFECQTDEECARLEELADKEFSLWAEDLEKNVKPVAEEEIATSDLSKKVSYKVEKGEKIIFKEGEDKAEYKEIWNSIKRLSPDALTDAYIETYEVFDNGDDDTLAFVDDEDANGKWRIAINLHGYKASTNKENKTTIIHELAHIISLNASQVVPNITTCTTLQLDEGCAKEKSPIYVFWSSFWKGAKDVNYDKRKFVTEYAATNETEDFAETFAFFVLLKEEDLGKEVKDQKIKMMYEFPELVSIRSQMRSELSKEIIRARK